MLNLRNLLFLLIFIWSSAAVAANTSASGIAEPTSTSPSYKADKWYRDSAERNAIYHEIFTLAYNVIQQNVQHQRLRPHQWGVIMDIDETVLDNSEWNLEHDIQNNPEKWDEYAAMGTSTRTPGAREFTQKIHQLGGYINLVSNRSATLLPATIKNLQRDHIVYDQILLDTSLAGTSFVDKNARFTAIEQGQPPSKLPPQKIVAWLGDNVGDFPHLNNQAMLQQDEDSGIYHIFGTAYFVLPNPMYGSWEKNDFK